jgi:hypothetical protein
VFLENLSKKMDKTDEWLQLYRVYGPTVTTSAQEFERPDFLVPIEGDCTLGVEITSVYMSSAHAKLNHLAEYSGNLIDRKREVHVADRESISVDELTLTMNDGTFVARATGIFHQMPSPEESVEILLRQIEEKERKTLQYDSSCAALDLVVLDGSNLFLHKSQKDFQDLFYAFYPKSKLIESPFREIYLLTHTMNQELVYMPLLANAFLAECYVYWQLISASVSEKPSLQATLQLMAACLDRGNYPSAKACIDSEGIKILHGAFEVYLPDDGFIVREWMAPARRHPGLPLRTIFECVPDGFEDTVNELLLQRATKFSGFVIAMPAHEQPRPSEYRDKR